MVYEMIAGVIPFGANATDPMQIMNEILNKNLDFNPILFDIGSS